jgi:hypothetical protein
MFDYVFSRGIMKLFKDVPRSFKTDATQSPLKWDMRKRPLPTSLTCIGLVQLIMKHIPACYYALAVVDLVLYCCSPIVASKLERFTIVGTFQPMLQCNIGMIYLTTEPTNLATMEGLSWTTWGEAFHCCFTTMGVFMPCVDTSMLYLSVHTFLSCIHLALMLPLPA